MTDFLWPSDMDRAESEELQRVCEHLEQVVDERDEYRGHLAQICEMLGETPDGKPDIGAAWEGVAALVAQNEQLKAEYQKEIFDCIKWHNSYFETCAAEGSLVNPDSYLQMRLEDAGVGIDPSAHLAGVNEKAIQKFLGHLFHAPSSPVSPAKAHVVADWWEKFKFSQQKKINLIRQEAQCKS